MLHWSDIRGQDRPKTILERALETGRVHHAYLFAGLEGVGKFETAKTFSAIINCLNRPEEGFRDACGECTACRKISEGYHPDVIAVKPDGNYIKIDQIREIQKEASKQPHEARSRMVLIDDAHTLTTEAANALLKTLEEPATRMRLILVTDQAHRLLETIISRCQQLRFAALEVEDIMPVLRQNLEASEDIDEMPDETTLRLAAGYGEGSLGRSWEILESGMLGEREELVRSIVELPGGRPAKLLDLAEDLGRSNNKLEDQLDVLKIFFRDLMLYKVEGDDSRVVNTDLVELLDRYADRLTLDDSADLLDDIFEAEEKIQRNVNPQLVMENLLPKLQLTA